MAPPYKRGYSFSGFQANQPRAPLPGSRLDIELDNIAGVQAALDLATQSLRPLPARSLNVNLTNAPAYPQPVTIDAFKTALGIDGLQPALGFTPENVTRRGQAGGYAPLDANAKVPAANLPPVDTTGLQPALGFTPENRANRGAANGYAPLGADSKVPLANLPDLGGGGGGQITASQITDSTPPGRSVLTGTAAQARTALQLGAAALLAVGVAGGVPAYDDPRFNFVPSAYGYTDPKAFGAKGDGVTDDSAAWQQAVNTGKVVVPSEGDYLINTTVNLPSYTTIHRDGHGLNRKVKIRTTANVTTFNATGNDGSIKGIAFYHTGAQGQCFKQNNYGSWVVQGNYFEATNNGSVASDIIHSSGALRYYTFNFFNNFRNNPDSFCIAFDKSPVDPNHCIENHVDMNYAGGKPGGSGPFLYIGSRVGRAANAYNIATKPEGIHVSFNSVQTHTYSVVVECVLLLHLNANSFCIGGGIVVLLRPTGPGIIDMRCVSNWYDSTDAPNVGGVIHNDDSYRNGPAAVIKGVRFMDRFDSGKYGALFGPNASGIDFSGSHFQNMNEVGILCDGTQNVTIGSDFESCGASVQLYDRANGGPFYLGKCNFSNSPPSFIMTDRSKFIMSYETSGYKVARKFAFVGPTNSFTSGTAPASSKGFVLIPHGLVGTPNINKCHVTCQGPPSGNGGAIFEGASATIIAADAANITLSVYISGLGANGNLAYNLDLSM